MAWNEPGNDNNNNNDPWGNRKRQSPPDIDEALRNIQRKIKKIFSGGNKSQLSGDGSNTKFLIGGVLGIFVFLWFITGFYIVGPADQAVVLRFGKYFETQGPGLHWIPRFVDSKTIVNVEKVYAFPYTNQMLTKDENIVSVTVVVQYHVSDPKNYLYNVAHPDKILQKATSSALRHAVGNATLDEILTTGKEHIKDEVYEQLEEILKLSQPGILLKDINVKQTQEPQEVRAAFDDVNKAREDKTTYENEAKEYSNRVKPLAEGDAQRIIESAIAYKAEVILKSEGDVARFLKILPQYQRAKRVTRDRLYIEAFESMLQNTSKVLVDVDGGNNILYLPLDKIMQQSRGGEKVSLSEVNVLPQSTATRTTKPTRSFYPGSGGYSR